MDKIKIDSKINRILASAAFDCAQSYEEIGDEVDIARKPSTLDVDFLKFQLGREPTSEELKKFEYYFRQELIGMSAP